MVRPRRTADVAPAVATAVSTSRPPQAQPVLRRQRLRRAGLRRQAPLHRPVLEQWFAMTARLRPTPAAALAAATAGSTRPPPAVAPHPQQLLRRRPLRLRRPR